MGETTDTRAVARGLNAALPMQARDAVAAALAAGTLPGPEGLALQEPMRAIAQAELADVERLAGRIAAFGATPEIGGADSVKLPKSWRAAVRRLLEMQRETLDALVEAIPADADDAEGEATEHLLEHVIDRKRNAIELLERALRTSG
ncbi:MAG: hypothetical protein K5924_04010 [Chloroflexi bacterium]|nr:hypothetical protein [Chloroflexota bacterium]